MKNMKIKLLSVIISALLCSHLWAQGSESAGQTFYIKLADEKNTTTQIKLTTENGMHRITSGYVPTNGYSAFFISDDGNYYIYDYKNGSNGWFSADTNETNAIETLFNYVKNQNSEIISEEGDIYISNSGYAEMMKSKLNINSKYNPVRTINKGFNDLYVYNKKKGIFLFVLYPQDDSKPVKILCFKDNKSIAELSKSLQGNENQYLTEYAKWLQDNKQNKKSNKKYDEYTRLSQVIYESLKNNKYKRFYNLYTSDNLLLRKYLDVAQNNNKNVYYLDYDKEYSNNFVTVDSNDGDTIARIANEYTKISLTSKKTIAMPYKTSGKDTPAELLAKYKEKKSSIRNSGCDDIGFLTSILINSNIRQENALPDDINKYSLIISDVNQVQLGDIVVFEQQVKEESRNHSNLKYGIIVEKNTTSVIGYNQKDLLGNISVVWMNEDKGAEKTQLSNIWKTKDGFDVPPYTEIRRILKKSEKNINSNTNWNVLMDQDLEMKVEIGWLRENTQISPERYRWIPNTGEFLNLEKVSIKAYNDLGVNINGNEWTVTLNGAIDRGWENNKSDAIYSNIYNNSNCKFEIYVEGVDDKKIILTKNGNKYDVSGDEIKFQLKGYDNILVYKDGDNWKPAVIQIRPENAKNARPGDDLLLTFKIENVKNKNSNANTDFTVTMQDKDYISVYDKKMLWRANLYLIKNDEPELGGLDWNNAHPWNAPSNSNEAQNAPYWWKLGQKDLTEAGNNWGYNEWNRKFDSSTFNGEIFTGLTALPQGDGGQVTDLISFTPIRTIGGTTATPDENNIIQNTVAYSFPMHNHEKETGDAGSMDSPFDFNKKMLVQQLQLNKWYNQNGNRKENIESQYNDNNWTFMHAPQNSWWHYEISFDDKYKHAFIPSLGLKILTNGKNNLDGYDENMHAITGVAQRNDFIDLKTSIEAGTDCIGFAQRSASYSNNTYLWYDLPKGWTEYATSGTNDIQTAMSKYNTKNSNDTLLRNYPSDSVEHNYNTGWPEVAVNIIEKKDINTSYKKIYNIVPGDIFVKDSLSDSDERKREHIAIVAYVPNDLSSYDIEELLDEIILIEAEYTNCIQSVIKTISLGDYHFNNLPKGTKFYPGFEIKTNAQSLNCQSWAIRRLK
ncbi:hypothetical protein [Treponema bryantii]|uniref:hypothetical protein n=1 Tax=Treponema bryantii TaxID=163 RepID=UPI002B2C4980|nr:hypothetical protein TRBR_12930 [Treponema bryantii]